MKWLIRRIGCHVFGHEDEWSMGAQRLICVNCGGYGEERFTETHLAWMKATQWNQTTTAVNDLAASILRMRIAIRDSVTPALQQFSEAMSRFSKAYEDTTK